MRIAFFFLVMVLGAALGTRATLHTQKLDYKEGGTVLEGYLAYDDAFTGRRPGVLVVHEWKGLSDYEMRRADMLARLGYVALAADVYGKGVRAKTTEEAAALAGRYKKDRALLRRRVIAGLKALKKDPRVDPARVAAIGFCFGGTAVLELARSGADLAGVVSFHGGLGLEPGEKDEPIRAKVLVLTGADDPSAPPPAVAAFEDEMRKAGGDYEVVSYGGAVHGFSNPAHGNDPKTGVAYNAEADRRSWQAMKDFLSEIFGANGA